MAHPRVRHAHPLARFQATTCVAPVVRTAHPTRGLAMNYLPLLLPVVLLILGTELVNADEVLTVNGCRIEADSQCPKANLQGANLQQSQLRLADFSNSTLVAINGWAMYAQAAKFNQADMRAANLEFARLS